MAKELAEHVHCTMTAGKPRLVHLQLAKTKSTWQRRAADVTTALQASDNVTTFLKSWLGQCAIQTTNQMVTCIQFPTTLAEYQEKALPSLDKWMFFPGINTNSLTPTGAKPSLDPRNIFSTFFAFTPLFFATYYIYSYSQLLLRHYWFYHLSPLGRYHIDATPLSLATTWFPNIFSSESIKNITVSSNGFCVSALD